MRIKSKDAHDNTRRRIRRACESTRISPLTPRRSQSESWNETAVPLTPAELSPHVRVIRPGRPSRTYERVE